MEEGFMEVVKALEADEETAVAMQPGEGALNDPAVTAEPGAGLDALACDARGDPSTFEGSPPFDGLVGLVGVELVRPLARRAGGLLDGRDGVDDIQEHRPLVHVGCRLEAGEGNALSVAHQMVLRPWFATISRVGTNGLGCRPPFFSPLAGTVELSMLARGVELPQKIIRRGPWLGRWNCR